MEYLTDRVMAQKDPSASQKIQKYEMKDKSDVNEMGEFGNQFSTTAVVRSKEKLRHWQLEADHIQPRWADGQNDESNLQVLCRKHNNFKYRKNVTGRSLVPAAV